MPTNDTIILLRIPDVIGRTGLSRSSIYNLIQRGLFPAPLRPVGTTVAVWPSNKVDAWIAQQIGRNTHV